MAYRKQPLVTGQFYHVYNRGVNKQPIFTDKRDYNRFMESLFFYSFDGRSLKLSKYLSMSPSNRYEYKRGLAKDGIRLHTLVSYCLMPNHFHLLLRQEVAGGVSMFMARLQNSYTRYYNSRHDRVGSLLQGQFKAVRLEDESQLMKLSRYIHLNPYTGYVVADKQAVYTYPWSSLAEYSVTGSSALVEKGYINSVFKGVKQYQSYIEDLVDYQKSLPTISHLLIEV